MLYTSIGNGIYIKIDSIKLEIFKDWLGMDVPEIINDAKYIEDIAFASLHHVMEFKLKLKRPKDIEHIIEIKKYINSKSLK